MSLETDIYDLFNPIITGTVIWADLNKPRPALPYSSIKMNSMRYVNQDHYSDATSLGIQTVTGDREFTLSIQNFGKTDCVTFLNGVVNKLRLNTNLDKFMAKKIVPFNTGAVLDISALVDNTNIEKRASLDVFIRIKSSITDNVGYINTTNVEGNDNSLAPIYTIIAVDI